MPPKAKSSKTTTEEITQRITQGKKFVERGIADRDLAHSRRYLDGSAAVNLLSLEDDLEGEGYIPETLETGNVNYLATNISTACASIAIADPDFYCEASDPDPQDVQMAMMAGMPPPMDAGTKAAITRQYLRDLWERREWARLTRKALLKRRISGMGIMGYLWHNDKGPTLEHVKVKDLAIDPNVSDWDNPRWAARRIYMPRKDAITQWPNFEHLFGTTPVDIPNVDAPASPNKDVVELWCYYDMEEGIGCEVILYGEEELSRTSNLYGTVPLLFLLGDILPGSEFPGGDYDAAYQLQCQLARLGEQINDQAENGGAIGWANPALLAEGSEDAFEDGKPSGFVMIQGSATDAFGYIQGIPMNPALLEAFRLSQQGMDSATGVSEYQRGVLSQGVKFATEAALLANQSGSRGVASRIEFEKFVNKIARAVVDMTEKFGKSLADPDSETDGMLFEALAGVNNISVIEASTSYKDPALEQQSSLQLLQALSPYIEVGIVNPIPLIADVFRAFQKRDVNKYLTPQALAISQQQQQQPAAPPGMNPAAAPAPGQQAGQPPGNDNPGGVPPMPPTPGAVTAVLNRASNPT